MTKKDSRFTTNQRIHKLWLQPKLVTLSHRCTSRVSPQSKTIKYCCNNAKKCWNRTFTQRSQNA